jgi:hypothetical protein
VKAQVSELRRALAEGRGFIRTELGRVAGSLPQSARRLSGAHVSAQCDKGARQPRVVLLTECPIRQCRTAITEFEFVRPCNLSPHMKRITLPKVRRVLETMRGRGTPSSA